MSQSGSTYDLIQWQNTGNVPRDKTRPEAEYFTCSETPDYTPMTIELDYDSNPLELGAFVNDICVGAVALMPEDTVVFMRAYLDGASPDSVVFQDWYGNKSSGKNIIREYSVLNKRTGIYERRAIKGNPGNNIIRVSFKKGEPVKNADEMQATNIEIWPNPASASVKFSFSTNGENAFSIKLLDISGRDIGLLAKGKTNKGHNSGRLVLNNVTGNSLKPGIYFLKIEIGNTINIKKLVII